MADTFSQTSTFASDTAAYEALAYFSLRPQLYFDAVADVKPQNQTHRGASTQFNIYTDLAAQTSTLSETADPDAIAASDSTVVVTPLEKGAVIKTTAKLRAQSFLDIDTDMANLIGYNAGLSLDTLARTQLEAGSNVRFGEGGTTTPTARANITPSDTLNADNVRRARADLVGANVPPVNGPLYWAFVDPDVAFDLRKETGAAAWRDPHTYSAPELIWSGEVGAFEGFRQRGGSKTRSDRVGPWNGNNAEASRMAGHRKRLSEWAPKGDATVRSATKDKLQLTNMFVETPRAPRFADAGSSPTTTDVSIQNRMRARLKPLLNNGNPGMGTRGKPRTVTPSRYAFLMQPQRLSEGAPKPIKHGSWSGYYTQKCRCNECRGWPRKAVRKYRARLKAGLIGKPLDQIRHGSIHAYSDYRCRCGVCVEAHNQRNREEYQRNKAKHRVKWARYRRSPRGKEHYRIHQHKKRQMPYTPEAKEYAAVIRNDPCSYCGERKPRMADEHVHRQESFTKRRTDWFDLTRACWSCNAIKRSRSLLATMLRVSEMR